MLATTLYRIEANDFEQSFDGRKDDYSALKRAMRHDAVTTYKTDSSSLKLRHVDVDTDSDYDSDLCPDEPPLPDATTDVCLHTCLYTCLNTRLNTCLHTCVVTCLYTYPMPHGPRNSARCSGLSRH